MSRTKKTFEVEKFKEYVNIQLARTDEHADDRFKSALCVALGDVLHKTGNYKGFTYLYWQETGFADWCKDGQTEVWEEKKKYIVGTPETKYHGSEHARRYF